MEVDAAGRQLQVSQRKPRIRAEHNPHIEKTSGVWSEEILRDKTGAIVAMTPLTSESCIASAPSFVPMSL